MLFSRRPVLRVEPVDSYIQRLSLTVGSELASGDYVLRAYTNFDNTVFELDGTIANNVASTNVTVVQQLPDLSVQSTSIAVKQNSTAAYIDVTVTVSNDGVGRTHESEWFDRVRLTRDDEAIVLTTRRQDTPVTAGSTYDTTWTDLIIPQAWSGNVTVRIEIDFLSVLVESDDNNNVQLEYVVLPTVTPDLTVDQITLASAQLEAGQAVEISWQVSNQGSKDIINTNWTDVILLQNADVTVKIDDVSRKQSLPAGSTLTVSRNVSVPLTLSGQFQLVVTTDEMLEIPEESEINNSDDVTVTISVPPTADLTVDDVSYQFDSNTRILSVTWVVQNSANSMTQTQTWTDAVFLSQTTTGPRVITLRSREVSGLLQAGVTYSASQSIVVPASVVGQYFVHIATDSENDILEINGENNNIGFAAGAITVPDVESVPVNIQITSAPVELVQGFQATVEYTVTISGNLIASSWTDSIYISAVGDLTLIELADEAFRVARYTQTSAGVINSAYTASRTFAVPFGSVENAVYIYVVADSNLRAGFVSPGLIEGALALTASPVSVVQGPLPDLTWADNAGGFEIVGGQPFTLTLNVTNVGETDSVVTFFSALYLSVNSILDPFDDKLTTFEHNSTVPVNVTSSLSVTGATPFDQASGLYYFIVALDTSNLVFELDDDNNELVLPVTMRETVSTDLQTDSVVMTSISFTFGAG